MSKSSQFFIALSSLNRSDRGVVHVGEHVADTGLVVITNFDVSVAFDSPAKAPIVLHDPVLFACSIFVVTHD